MSPSPPARALLGLIQIYKWTLSPFIGNACRYRPTCSSYAADCVRAHGAWAGSWMSAARLCRCAPWGGQGWDPAPEVIKRNSWWRPWRYGDWKGPPPTTLSLAERVARDSAPGEGRADVAMSANSGEAERPSPPTPSPQGRGGRNA